MYVHRNDVVVCGVYTAEIVLALLSPRDNGAGFDDSIPSLLMTEKGLRKANVLCMMVRETLRQINATPTQENTPLSAGNGDQPISTNDRCELLKETDFVLIRLNPAAGKNL